MRIVKRYRALLRIYGIASCALLACGEAAHAKQIDDRNGDIAAHGAIHNKKNNADFARGGPLHLLGWSSEHKNERAIEKIFQPRRKLSHHGA